MELHGDETHGEGKAMRRFAEQRNRIDQNCYAKEWQCPEARGTAAAKLSGEMPVSAKQRNRTAGMRYAKELQCREWKRDGKQKNKEEKQ